MSDTGLATELLPGYRLAADGAWVSLPWPDDLADLPPSLGPQIVAWGHAYLLDHITGDAWEYTLSQRKWLHLAYAVRPDGRWVYRRCIRRGAKGPIAHDVPVMTPNGWKSHGDLLVGDQVYAVDGSITTVTGLRDEVLQDTYRIHFRDGSSVICTGSHRWPMDEFTGSGRRRVIVTVDEMLERGVTWERPLTTGRTKATRAGVARWCTIPSPEIAGSHVEFPIPPYLLGYWLGDGDSDCPRITCHADDIPSLRSQCERLNVEMGDPRPTHGETYRIRFGRGWAQKALRTAGLLNNKHIPSALLRSSADQRWELLRGLVDSDGTIGTNGRVEIAVAVGPLADGIFELAITLGLMPTRNDNDSALNGKKYQRRARIAFTPLPGQVVSHLPRKAARAQVPRTHRRPFSRSRTVVSIDPVTVVPARCITVDHPSHQYLVGERNVPTCNTGKDPLAAAMALTEACGPVVFDGFDAHGRPVGRPHRMSLAQVGANSEGQGADVLRVANGMISADLAAEESADPGILRTLFSRGRRIEVLTNSESSAEGDPATAVFLNETHHMTPSSGRDRLAKVGRRNAAKSRDGRARAFEFTNAHLPGEGSVGENTFEAWQKQVAGTAARQDILYDSREAAPHLRLHVDAERKLGIAQAYADAPWVDQERIEDEALDPDTPPADSVRFYFNALPTNETDWVSPRAWDARGTAGPLPDHEPITLFLDCSKSSDATALTACRMSDGAVYAMGCWQKPHGDRGKDWLAPREEVDAVVRFIFDNYDVQWFGVDPSPARDDDTEALYWADTIDSWHRDFRDVVAVWATPGKATGNAVLFDMRMSKPGARDRLQAFTEMAELTAAAVDEPDGDLVHDGDPLMRLHVHNARRRPNQWGISIGKSSRTSSKHIDYAVTVVGARLGRRIVLNNPTKTRKRTGVVV